MREMRETVSVFQERTLILNKECHIEIMFPLGEEYTFILLIYIYFNCYSCSQEEADEQTGK